MDIHRTPARLRMGSVALVAGLAAVMAGCGGRSPAASSGTTAPASSSVTAPASGPAGNTPSVTMAATSGPPDVSGSPAQGTTTQPAVPALTCAQLKSAEVGSATVHYNGYPDGIPLGGLGVWSGEDGSTVELQPQCAIGDLTGDGAKDALGVVTLSNGGSGRFFTLVAWKDSGGDPVCVALADLGDRTPVVSISISGQRATVVYDTRADNEPMAILSIKRTAVYQLAGSALIEVSHTDEPYSG